MKEYLITRCILGIVGSAVAIILGGFIVVQGIRYANVKGFTIGMELSHEDKKVRQLF